MGRAIGTGRRLCLSLAHRRRAAKARQISFSEDGSLRRLGLVELIKVDLEYRWQKRSAPKLVEEYASEFPELVSAGMLPADLIYEEYHIRKQSGDQPAQDEYRRRFPAQIDQLSKLLDLEQPHLTTTVSLGEKAPQVEVGEKLDDFDLLARLGKGAFATVFLARQRSMQRLVALKVSSDRGAEPQTLAQLDHANIVRVYDQRQIPDRKLRLLYMQLVPGGTLQSVIEICNSLPPGTRTGKALLTAVDIALERKAIQRRWARPFVISLSTRRGPRSSPGLGAGWPAPWLMHISGVFCIAM